MTVLEDRIAMAETSGELTLDVMFEHLEKMPIPEGTKVEIVGGNIFMAPQRNTHWDIIAAIYDQLRNTYPRNRVKSDVRIDYPGYLNGFASDITLLAKEAEQNEKGLWRYEDVVFVAEVISQSTAANDYGPKKTAYARARIPVYLIADPYQGKLHLHTRPKDGDYAIVTQVPFGENLDLSDTVVGLTLKTDEFPRG